jgi:hypothetical protein
MDFFRHFVCTENIDKFNIWTHFIVYYSTPKNIIYIETFTYIIDSNDIKLKCI